jgi:hypothetical protein
MWDQRRTNKKENSMIGFAEFVKLTSEEKDELRGSIRFRNAPWRLNPIKSVFTFPEGKIATEEEQAELDLLNWYVFERKGKCEEEDHFSDRH